MRLGTNVIFFGCVSFAMLSVAYGADLPAIATQAMTEDEFGAQIESYLLDRQFDTLELTAEVLRDPNIRFVGGNSRIFRFYVSLAAHAGDPLYGYSSSVPFKTKRQLLEQWLSEKPDSITARIALAQMWSCGCTSMAGAHSHNVDIETANSYLTGIDLGVDPYAYYVMMQLQIQQSTSTSGKVLDSLYPAAIRDYPNFFHYYSQRARLLQQRWYGKNGELQDYVKSLLGVPGGDDGAVAYSYVASTLIQSNERPTIFQATGLSWPFVKAAYAVRERRFGLRNFDWNTLCNFAVGASDRETARLALEHIGSDWDPDVWREKKIFDLTVAWIRDISHTEFANLPTTPNTSTGVLKWLPVILLVLPVLAVWVVSRQGRQSGR